MPKLTAKARRSPAAIRPLSVVVCTLKASKEVRLKVYGYARCSTDKQSTDSQVHALLASSPKPERLFIDEGVSGKTMNRPEFHRLLEVARAGDLIVFYSLSRASRSTLDALTLMAQLDEREVGYRSLSESVDNSTPAGRAMTAMVAAFAAYERESLQARTKAGLEAARARGVTLGRKRVLTPKKVAFVRELKAGGRSVSELAESFQVSERTIWRALASPSSPVHI